MSDYDYRSCKNCVYYLPTPEGGTCNAFHTIRGDESEVTFNNQCLDFEADKSYADFISCASLSTENLECLDDTHVNSYNWDSDNAVFDIKEPIILESWHDTIYLLITIDNPDLIIRHNSRCPIRCRDVRGEVKLLELEESPFLTRFFSNQHRLKLTLECRGGVLTIGDNIWKIISIEETLEQPFVAIHDELPYEDIRVSGAFFNKLNEFKDDDESIEEALNDLLNVFHLPSVENQNKTSESRDKSTTEELIEKKVMEFLDEKFDEKFDKRLEADVTPKPSTLKLHKKTHNKLIKAIESIKDYNSSVATCASERWEIVPYVIQQLTGCRKQAVDRVLNEMNDDIILHHTNFDVEKNHNRIYHKNQKIAEIIGKIE